MAGSEVCYVCDPPVLGPPDTDTKTPPLCGTHFLSHLAGHYMGRPGDHALVIGGTKGLGLELVREASIRGIQTLSLGRSGSDGEEVGQAFSAGAKDFSNALFLTGDITRPTGLISAYGNCLSRFSYLFLVAGEGLEKPFSEVTSEELYNMYALHITGPRVFVKFFHNFSLKAGHPYHLVVIASTSSWRMRDNESVYAEVQAAKAMFARQFSRELARDLPGSKTTLVCPGGMATPNFYRKNPRDISEYMKPRVVAQLVWDTVSKQRTPFEELNILRGDGGTPVLRRGQQTPESPVFETGASV